jgi:hypothetical protein
MRIACNHSRSQILREITLRSIGPGSKGIPCSYDARNAIGDSLRWEGEYNEMAIGVEHEMLLENLHIILRQPRLSWRRGAL